MSFSSIQTIPQADGFTVTVALPDGRTISQRIDDATGVLPVAVGCWGIDGGGRAYFDSQGASPGEEAVLGWDPTAGSLYLETATDRTLDYFALREGRESARMAVGEIAAGIGAAQKAREQGRRRRYTLRMIRKEPECDASFDPATAREARWRASGNRNRG